MRRKRLSFKILTIFCVFLSFSTPAFAANTENFYFEDFTGDYYLSRDAEGVSHLKVVENFTAVFPDYKQNKGICRMIPFTNQNNKNVTLPNLTSANIKITRNGNSEPIYSIEKEENSYKVCTGDESYVFGKQSYVFEFSFEKVVTDFENFQELYWDTNGNGWTQKFDKVTARVHFTPEVASSYTGDRWCYVGKYGENRGEKCVISEISDGVKFETENLSRFENLTFDIEFKPGSFVIPAPEKNYELVFIMIGFFVMCVLILLIPFKKFLRIRGKMKYYNEIFVKPEFTPDKNLNVAEMAEIYIGKKKDAKVAVLLEMIVNHQIVLVQKGETLLKHKKWAIKILKVDKINEERMYLIRILAGGKEVNNGDEIEIKMRTATSSLISLRRKYEKAIIEKLKERGLVEDNYKGGIL